MKFLYILSLAVMGGGFISGLFSSPTTKVSTYHQLKALDINRNQFNFESLKGKVVLVANVASK
jgi:Glutathione peroxidase